MLKWLVRFWRMLFYSDDPILLTLPKPEPVLQKPLPVVEVAAPVRVYSSTAGTPPPVPPAAPLTFEMKVYRLRSLPDYLIDLTILCNEASKEEMIAFLPKATSIEEREVIEEAIEAVSIATETAEEKFYRTHPMFGTWVRPAIIEPSGGLGRVIGDPNSTAPHIDVIPDHCKPSKNPRVS